MKHDWHPDSDAETPKTEERFSVPYIFRWRKYQTSDSATTTSTADGLRDCFTTTILLIVALCLTFIVVLWLVSLIVDGPIETHRCVTLWPIVAGVLIICFLFLSLGSCDYCIWKLNRRRNMRTAWERSTLGQNDSLQIERRQNIGSTVGGTNGGYNVAYQQHSCVSWCYLFLTIALFCLMISSVWQYFSLDSSCYSELKVNVEELLLGYELLAYMSTVVLSLISFVLLCCICGIFLKCLKSLFGCKTQNHSYTVTV